MCTRTECIGPYITGSQDLCLGSKTRVLLNIRIMLFSVHGGNVVKVTKCGRKNWKKGE